MKITVLDTLGAALAGSASTTAQGGARVRLYFRGDYDEAALLGQLGERYEITSVSLKPYPTCKYTHHAIATALRLVERHDVRAAQVKRVTVATNTMGAVQCGFDAAGRRRPLRRPRSGEIQHSVHGGGRHRPTARDPGGVHRAVDPRPRVRELAGRVQTRIDPAEDALPMLLPPMDVTIETSDGRVLSGCEEFVKGDPRNTFTFEDCVERFVAAAASAARPPAGGRSRALCDDGGHLEAVKDRPR